MYILQCINFNFHNKNKHKKTNQDQHQDNYAKGYNFWEAGDSDSDSAPDKTLK